MLFTISATKIISRLYTYASKVAANVIVYQWNIHVTCVLHATWRRGPHKHVREVGEILMVPHIYMQVVVEWYRRSLHSLATCFHLNVHRHVTTPQFESIWIIFNPTVDNHSIRYTVSTMYSTTA